MAIRGRKPKPTVLKVLSGNPGKRPLNEKEPKPDIMEPRKPYGVMPKRALKIWNELAPQLLELGVLTVIDGPAFALLCIHWAIAIEASKLVREAEEELGQGIITEDDRGRERKHRALQVLRDATREFKSLGAEFGLTPSSRSRLEIEAPEEIDELDQLLRRASGQ